MVRKEFHPELPDKQRSLRAPTHVDMGMCVSFQAQPLRGFPRRIELRQTRILETHRAAECSPIVRNHYKKIAAAFPNSALLCHLTSPNKDMPKLGKPWVNKSRRAPGSDPTL